MSIANEEQRTPGIDRQINRGAFADLVVIHVATVGPTVTRSKCLMFGGRERYSAQHRPKRDAVVLKVFTRFFETPNQFFTIENPIAVEIILIFGLLNIPGRQRGGSGAVTRNGGIAV